MQITDYQSVPNVLSPSGTILVVENHPDTLKYMVMFLEELGYRTIQASTMSGALAASPGKICSILVSDIGLPDGDGWELLRRLKQEGRAPILAVAMSGLGMNADAERSRKAGYRHHLIKPFDPAKLENILEEAQSELR